MAERPVFIPIIDSNIFFKEILVQFTWHSGYSYTQKQRSIQSLHSNAKLKLGLANILEISTKSENELGRKLSAFNLFLEYNKNQKITVEAAYQGSKVFEKGGPFNDLYLKDPFEIKKDERLKNSGNIISFKYKKTNWSINPPTSFYDWLYIKALNENFDLSKQLLDYDGFTDIVFNPSFSLNCQARAAALFVSISKRGLMKKTLLTHKNFLKLYADKLIQQNQHNQLFLFNKQDSLN